MYSTEELQKIIDENIKSQSLLLNSKQPQGLYAPVEYSLGMGGKRLRPVLLLMGYNLFSDHIEKAIPAALAVEVFHNFTLLHDDIMDNAEMRRNQPAVHKKFSKIKAILSGDAMAFLSYRYLLSLDSDRLTGIIKLFTETALEVCEGQQYDMDFEKRQNVTEAAYLEMIRLKTAVLLACSLKAGALLANADSGLANQIYDFGINLGMAFQLQDDLLDTFGDQQIFGKKIGGDILADKKTFLLIKAQERASAGKKAEIEKWLSETEFDPDEKIEGISNIFNQLGIKEITEQKIDSYFVAATEILQNLPVNEERKTPLKKLSKTMLGRSY